MQEDETAHWQVVEPLYQRLDSWAGPRGSYATLDGRDKLNVNKKLNLQFIDTHVWVRAFSVHAWHNQGES